MGLADQVLPEHLSKAKELSKIIRECKMNMQLLRKQLEQANRNGEEKVYLELIALFQQQEKQAKEAEQELSNMYFEKQEREWTEVHKVVLRMREIGIKEEVIRKILKP
ncbi:hypothetical protein ACIGHG_23330 [Bacillus sp. NPDC077411]|uniref:hypothetical protein n=1 Tax=Bacillus sp. NPDC077411 TaxID=3363947 RepID=UPI0037C861BF